MKVQTIKKPWGMEEIIEVNDRYMFKRLTMHSGFRCSLQYHNFKCETIYVLSGRLRIYIGTDVNTLEERDYGPHETVTILPGMIHRMEAVTDSIYLESSTPEISDVIRLADDFNRIEK